MFMYRVLARVALLALCAGAALSPLQGQGAAFATPARPQLNSVVFVDTTHGWAAGQGIYATTDGGRHWQRQYAGSSQFSQLDFVDALHGWAVGDGGQGTPPLLLRTVDGGQHWLPAGEPPAPLLRSVQFLTPTLGFGVTLLTSAAGGALVQTTDGGLHWRGVHTPLRVAAVCFADAQHGWTIALQGDAILHTTNGGKSWARSFTAGAAFQNGGQLSCTSPTSAWALLYGGVGMNQQSYAVYRTVDGLHWRAVLATSSAGGGPAPGIPAHTPSGISGYNAVLTALNGQTAYLLGGCPPCGGMGQTYVGFTHDGGKHWTNGKALSAVAFGTLALSFPTPNDGWLISSAFPAHGGQPYGVILHSSDGGSTWTRQFPTA